MKIRVTASRGTVVGVSRSVGEALLAAGLAVAAEDGPEVVRLPAGSAVVETRPAQDRVETR